MPVLMANLQFFKYDYASSKAILQAQVRRFETHNVDLILQSWVHNNLAFVSWMHLLELPKIDDPLLKQ